MTHVHPGLEHVLHSQSRDLKVELERGRSLRHPPRRPQHCGRREGGRGRLRKKERKRVRQPGVRMRERMQW